MSKYKFRFRKKSVHLTIPHNESEPHIDVSLKGVRMLKTMGIYTDDELRIIGNIPMGTVMNMFKEIR
jgi:hypothetical protein